MSASTLAADLTAWVLQTALLLGVGLLLPPLFRMRAPRACLAYWQGLLLAVLLLPLLQPDAGRPLFVEGAAVDVTGRWLGRLAEPGADTEGSWLPHRLLLTALAAGVLARLAWLGFGLHLLRSWRRDARPAVLAPTVVELAGHLGLGERVRLLVSPRVESPVTFGWRRPVVLLPVGFPELAPEAQRGIVCHELVHVRRRDWLFALFEEGVRALLWFHPTVWMLLARIGLSREQVVDREAVRLTGSRRAYLEALRVVASRSWQTAVPGLPFFHRGHLRERVTQLCKEVPMSRSRIAALMTTFSGLLALTAVLGILAFPMAGTSWAGGEPLEVEGDVMPPTVLYREPPAFPVIAWKSPVERIVIIKTVIDEHGLVKQAAVERSSGDEDLDRAVLDDVSDWMFLPATLDGKPVSVFYPIAIRFAADEEKEPSKP